MTEHEEVDRYEQLLNDWRPGPQKSQQKATGQPLHGSPALTGENPMKRDGRHEPGAILLLEGKTLVVYKQHVPEKEYHLVMALAPNGTAKVQGVALNGYKVEELGSLPDQQFEKLQRERRWNRDMIVFHCYSYEDINKIPEAFGGGAAEASPGATPKSPPQAAPAPEQESEAGPAELQRGQRLQIKFGPKMWDAVYWGQDDQGHVVAHKTYNKWQLMHLELERFRSSMEVDPQADAELVQQIEKGLNGTAH